MIVLWSVVVEVFAIGRVPLTEVPLYIQCRSLLKSNTHKPYDGFAILYGITP